MRLNRDYLPKAILQETMAHVASGAIMSSHSGIDPATPALDGGSDTLAAHAPIDLDTRAQYSDHRQKRCSRNAVRRERAAIANAAHQVL
jgi:hypothetical protein